MVLPSEYVILSSTKFRIIDVTAISYAFFPLKHHKIVFLKSLKQTAYILRCWFL